MAIDFPNTPTVGQQFTAAGVTWTWDGTKWTPAGLGTSYLPLAGGTLTGPLIAPQVNANILAASDGVSVPSAVADPPPGDNDHSLATTAWANANVKWGDNRLINGDMRIAQRGTGASLTANAYTVDRWAAQVAQTGRLSWAQAAAGPPLIASGFGYNLQFTSASAYTPLATDAFGCYQAIEADMVSDFAWGMANAQPVTLSFWAISSLTGTFSGAIRNQPSPPTRVYPFTFNIPVASTWTRIVINIPGDTAGAWTLSGNAAGMQVLFDLGSGANFRTSGNAWTTGNIFGVTGSVSLVGTNGANFNITGVKLEIGSIATPYNHPPLAQAMAACQRYYQTYNSFLFGGYGGVANASLYTTLIYQNAMRAQPTITPSAVVYNNASSFVMNAPTIQSVRISMIVAAPGSGYTTFNFTADAEL